MKKEEKINEKNLSKMSKIIKKIVHFWN